MLRVNNIWAKGRHTPLFDRTTFSVGEGEVIIVQADSQLERTSLALALTGRLPLSGGTISWSEGDDEPRRISMKRLRALSSVVDSPDVTAPEQHMRVHDYVSEMLSYNLPIFGRSRASRWLAERGLEDLDGLWMDEISGEMNIELMAALAKHSPSDLLVFDTPSRHLTHTYMWLPYLEELAADEDHPRTVVAIVPHISESWHGARAVVGHAPEEDQLTSAEDAEPSTNLPEQEDKPELAETQVLPASTTSVADSAVSNPTTGPTLDVEELEGTVSKSSESASGSSSAEKE